MGGGGGADHSVLARASSCPADQSQPAELQCRPQRPVTPGLKEQRGGACLLAAWALTQQRQQRQLVRTCAMLNRHEQEAANTQGRGPPAL